MHKQTLFIVTTLFLSCTQILENEQIGFQNGFYCEKNTTKPYSGKICARFSDGSLSDESLFKDGVPQQAISYGFQGEIVTKTKFITVPVKSFIQISVLRVILSQREEGAIRLSSLYIIVYEKDKKQLSELTCRKICKQAVYGMEKLRYFDLRKEDGSAFSKNLPIKLSTGEYEPVFFEVSADGL